MPKNSIHLNDCHVEKHFNFLREEQKKYLQSTPTIVQIFHFRIIAPPKVEIEVLQAFSQCSQVNSIELFQMKRNSTLPFSELSLLRVSSWQLTLREVTLTWHLPRSMRASPVSTLALCVQTMTNEVETFSYKWKHFYCLWITVNMRYNVVNSWFLSI